MERTFVSFVVCIAAAACGNDGSGKEGKNVGPDAGMGTDSGGNNGSNNGTSGGGGPLPADGFEVCGAGWCWVNPMPYGAMLQAVHGADDDVYIVGSGGTVLQRTGGSWSGRALPGTHFDDVYAVREDLAYAVGWSTTSRVTVNVHRWDGDSWELFGELEGEQVANRGAQITPAAVWASEDEVFVGAGPELHHFDGSWQKSSTPADGPWMPGDEEWVADIACRDDACFAVGQVGSHLAFASEGFVWRLDGGAFVDDGLEVGPLTTIDVRPDGAFVAAGTAAATWVYAGDTWQQSDEAPGGVADMVFSPDGREWAATSNLFWQVHARQPGEDWVAQALPFQRTASWGPGRALPGIYATNSELFYVGRDDRLTGEIARFDGTAWEAFSTTSAFVAEIIDLDLSESVAVAATESKTYVWELATGERREIDVSANAVFVDGERVFLTANGISEVVDGGLEPTAGAPENVGILFGLSADTMFAASGTTVHRYDAGSWTSASIPEESIQVRAL